MNGHPSLRLCGRIALLRPGGALLSLLAAGCLGSNIGRSVGWDDTEPAWGADLADEDLDGITIRDGDCDDTDAEIHPGADERCNELDDDCNGEVDEGIATRDWYLDADEDGYGDPDNLVAVDSCSGPTGTIADKRDCDDTDPEIHPDAEERCDEVDRDCDGSTTQGATDQGRFFEDLDRDGFGDPDTPVEACDREEGQVTNPQDCDDLDPTTHPGATECGDGRDNDCDGLVDEDDPEPAESWFLDLDLDGYGALDHPRLSCSPVPGRTTQSGDCDDEDPALNPGAAEICDAVDNDCDGLEDEADPDLDPADLTWLYDDADGDGYGSPRTGALRCFVDASLVENGEDCDDRLAEVFPGATEICGTGVVEDCDSDPAEVTGWCDLIEEDSLAVAAARRSGSANDWLGLSVAILSDWDGDGLDEALTAAPYSDSRTHNAGAVWLLDPLDRGDSPLGSTSPLLTGSSSSDYFGASLAGADTNGDGIADLAVGATGTSYGGTAYIFLGPATTSGTAARANGQRRGAGTTALAETMALGDIDGDGLADLLLGDPSASSDAGAIYLFTGPVTGTADTDAARLQGAGAAASDGLGTALAIVGDTDGDGLSELLVGAPGADDPTDAGAAWLVGGDLEGDLQDQALAELRGSAAGDALGQAVSGFGDWNADGYADLALTATGVDTGGVSGGALYFLNGPLSGTLDVSSAAFATWLGAKLERAGDSLATADIDQDGELDALLGARACEGDLGANQGRVWLLLGPMSGTHDLEEARAWWSGETASSSTGSSLATGGDLDGDGTIDLLIGAQAADDPSTNGGATYMVLQAGF